MRKVYGIIALVFSVALLSSCVADMKYEPKMSSHSSNLQWEEKNGNATLPLAAAMDFCDKEAADESAKIAAILSLDKTNTAGSFPKLLETESFDTVKAIELSKCMSGLGYAEK